MRRLQASPPLFTPNGDEINDQTEISYDLLNIGTSRKVALHIYDLSGHIVRELLAAPSVAGSFSALWDGRDGEGSVVPPGIYLYQVDLGADEENFVVSGTVSVAY